MLRVSRYSILNGTVHDRRSLAFFIIGSIIVNVKKLDERGIKVERITGKDL